MKPERLSRGFEPAGRIGPEELGLPKKRARELLLAVAWRRVAGEALAAGAEARRVSRGILEVEALEPRAAETLRALLPELAGRIAAAFPALGVRKCRLIEAGGGSAPNGYSGSSASRVKGTCREIIRPSASVSSTTTR